MVGVLPVCHRSHFDFELARNLGAQGPQHFVVQQPVARDRIAAPTPVDPVQSGEPAAGLAHDRHVK